MKAILYPTSPDHVNSILKREQVFYSIGKAMNDTQHPMPVYLYETKNSGGTGKITGVVWIGPGYKFQRGSINLVAAMAYCPEITFSAQEIGGKEKFFYEILHRERFNVPKGIEEVVWHGSIKPPRTWKKIEV